MSDRLAIATIYPDLLGTYGDGGNAITLVHRARLRSIAAEVIGVQPGDPVPRHADIYVLGGGEDTAQVAACNALREDGGLAAAAERGAPILAICAGYQLLGAAFPDATGAAAPGLGLLDVTTTRLPRRAVGELAAQPPLDAARGPGDAARGPGDAARGPGDAARGPGDAARGPGDSAPLLARDRFTGYENHAGGTHRGPGVAPLGIVLEGVGNGDGTEGAVSGRVIGTYLHGPCLARNPDIADQLLVWASGRSLPEAVEQEVQQLRAERFRTVLGG